MPVFSWNVAAPGDSDLISPFPALDRADKTVLANVLGTLNPSGTNTVGGRQSEVLSNVIYFDLYNAYFDGTNWQRDDTAQPSCALQVNTDGSINLVWAAAGGNPIGTSWPNSVSWVSGGTGRLLAGPSAPQITVYTSGSGTYTTPTGARWIKGRLVGAGGGSGGSTSSSGAAGGAGAGGYLEKTYTSPSASYAYAVGAGGAGGALGGSGSNGAVSTFGPSLSANGGSSSAVGGLPGAGGVASGGDVNVTGGQGGIGVYVGTTIQGVGGQGGGSAFGGGPAGGNINANGNPGVVPGTGGSGAGCDATNSRTGAAGAPGLIIVEAFF